MKKITFLSLSMAAIFAFASCTSTSTMDAPSKKQAEINKSFDKVYSTHAGSLVLDGAETYVVQKGDTLTSITKKFYAGEDENGYYFPMIMLASRGVVSDPELIEPGMKLTIPNFDKNIKDRKVAKKLSPFFKDLTGVYKQKDTPAAADILPHLIEISDQLAKDEPSAAEGASDSQASSSDNATPPKTSSEPVPMM